VARRPGLEGVSAKWECATGRPLAWVSGEALVVAARNVVFGPLSALLLACHALPGFAGVGTHHALRTAGDWGTGGE
jgi:hypothetical protein